MSKNVFFYILWFFSIITSFFLSKLTVPCKTIRISLKQYSCRLVGLFVKFMWLKYRFWKWWFSVIQLESEIIVNMKCYSQELVKLCVKNVLKTWKTPIAPLMSANCGLCVKFSPKIPIFPHFYGFSTPYLYVHRFSASYMYFFVLILLSPTQYFHNKSIHDLKMALQG